MINHSVLYLECNSGISGDMTVAALLDLGADRETLITALESLPLSGYSIEIKDVFKSGIRACDFHVILDKAHENHDHDMEYLHGHAHTHTHAQEPGQAHIHEYTHTQESGQAHIHGHSQEPGQAHTHEHSHSQEFGQAHIHEHSHSQEPGQAHSHEHSHSQELEHAHSHNARNLNDIVKIILAGNLTENAKMLAIKIFRILAEAEAFVHGKSIDEVHFHEVGAVDSIVDIVAAAVCIDSLQPSQVVVSPLTDGTGQIRCQHGLIPVPVPAVAAIAANEGLTLKISQVEGELVTPTGAAIAAALQSGASLPENFRILKMGFGAGKREYASTGLLRAMLLEPVSADGETQRSYTCEHQPSDDDDVILTLETNIDDCTGEALAFTMEQLLQAGALDAFFTPIYMKKNRPACLLKVICEPKDLRKLESIIFRNTTTIGIRIQEMRRTKLKRRILAVETPWGMADVKCCVHDGETYYYPENDSVCKLAAQEETGFPEMYNRIQAYVQTQEGAQKN